MRGKGCSSLIFGLGCPGHDRACPAIFCSGRCELETQAFKMWEGGRGMVPKISKRHTSTTTIKAVKCGMLNVPPKLIAAQVQNLAGIWTPLWSLATLAWISSLIAAHTRRITGASKLCFCIFCFWMLETGLLASSHQAHGRTHISAEPSRSCSPPVCKGLKIKQLVTSLLGQRSWRDLCWGTLLAQWVTVKQP